MTSILKEPITTLDDSQEQILHQFFENVLPDTMADDLLVRSTASSMLQRLRLIRGDGGSGWYAESTSNSNLRTRLTALASGEPLSLEGIEEILCITAMMRLRLLVYGDRA